MNGSHFYFSVIVLPGDLPDPGRLKGDKMIDDEYRDNLEWACMNMKAYTRKRPKLLSEAFLRSAYKYTKAETKDRTQEDLHAYDYRK